MSPGCDPRPALNPDYRPSHHHHPTLPLYLSPAILAQETEVGDPRPMLSTVLDQV